MISLFDLFKMTAPAAVLAYINRRIELSKNKAEIAQLEKKKKELENKLGKKNKKLLSKKLSTGMTLAQVIARDIKKNQK